VKTEWRESLISWKLWPRCCAAAKIGRGGKRKEREGKGRGRQRHPADSPMSTFPSERQSTGALKSVIFGKLTISLKKKKGEGGGRRGRGGKGERRGKGPVGPGSLCIISCATKVP